MDKTQRINADGYITLAQYAEIKGISKQAVYQQSRLKDLIIELYGMKVIPLTALSDDEIQVFQGIFNQDFQENQGENQEFQAKSKENQGNSSQENQENIKENQPTIQEIQAQEIEFLRSQLIEKDKIIASLTAQLANAHSFDTQLAELIHNSQVLLLNTQKTLPANSEAEAEETPPRKGFFSRIRKKNK